MSYVLRLMSSQIVPLLVIILATSACGPSAKEIREAEQRRADSIKQVAVQDSLRQLAIADSIALAQKKLEENCIPYLEGDWPLLRPGNFKQTVNYFLACMQQSDIKRAARYSTDFGLRSFLLYDDAQVDTYKIGKTEVNDMIGTAKVSVNGGKQMTFFFNRINGRWRFVGPDYWNK